MPKCKGCGIKCESRGIVAVCGADACYKIVADKAAAKAKVARERRDRDAKKEFRRETKRRREAIKTRAEWYRDLQKEVNYYAKHILYRGHNCYTCDKPQSGTDTSQAFHAGHYRSVGACPELRFEPRNIRVQCYSCNCSNSGMRKEYRDAIYMLQGSAELDWLDGNSHTSLKDVFPHIDDIRAEIARYRKLIRDAKDDS